MENGGGSSLMMLGSSYGGEGDQHHHHHHNSNNNSLNMNIDVVNGLSRGSSGGSPHPHAMMMMMPLTSSTTTTTTSFHPYISHHNDSGHPHNATNHNNLPPLPSPLLGDAGAGSSNIPHFMMLDNNYYNTHNPKSHQNLNPNSNNMMSNTTHGGGGGDDDRGSCSSLKAKIMAHPHYPRLLAAYVNCQKVGAPPEVVARLEESFDAALRCGGSVRRRTTTAGEMGSGESSAVGVATAAEDPSLDQFMEAYCEMLSKYEQELTKPFKEAMLFLSKIESQFKSLSLSSSSSSPPDSVTACGEANDRNGSSEEEIDVNTTFVDPLAEDRELKCQLLRKYSGYLGSLKQEFMKKRKKGKLPKEARQQLLEWWTRHYKWPYPSESQKLALSEATGLDLKQINNWFINQRKRHWKPSEDMQFVVMDATSAHHHPHYYMDNVLGNPFPMDISPALL